MNAIFYFIVALIFILILSGCTTTRSNVNQSPQELNDGWTLSTPSQEGVDPKQLIEMVDNIIKGKYENIHSVVIVKNGKLVFEEYFDWYHQGRKHELRSATKSITSILGGINSEFRVTNVRKKGNVEGY